MMKTLMDGFDQDETGDGKWGRFLQDKLASLILVRNPAN
jgi:hypothetical protein